MPKAPHAYIFDLDGTLLDTLPSMLEAFNLGLAAHNMPTHTEEVYRKLMDEGMKKIFTRSMPEGTSEEKIKEVVLTTRDYYRELWRKGTRPFPAVEEVLQKITDAEIPMTILTNKPHVFALEVIDHFFPDTPFVHIQGASPDVPSKPDPTAAQKQIKMLDKDPREIYFVGDSVEDILTAKKVGTTAVAVTWGFRPEKELRDAGADIIIHHPKDLLFGL